MKLLIYSDLHLEFGKGLELPNDGDVLILAGDIITFNKFHLLSTMLEGCNKPVLYVAGNHEYYTKQAMQRDDERFKKYIQENHPNIIYLQDQAVSIDGINFFGGTMWTDFNKGDPLAMLAAKAGMNDYHLIKNKHSKNPLTPSDTITFHNDFVQKLMAWFEKDLPGKRVVISHHAPISNPNSNHYMSNVRCAYVSEDMLPIIDNYQPDFWIYGHTHDTDDRMIGNTRIVSNPRGYPISPLRFECKGFDNFGLGIKI